MWLFLVLLRTAQYWWTDPVDSEVKSRVRSNQETDVSDVLLWIFDVVSDVLVPPCFKETNSSPVILFL